MLVREHQDVAAALLIQQVDNTRCEVLFHQNICFDMKILHCGTTSFVFMLIANRFCRNK